MGVNMVRYKKKQLLYANCWWCVERCSGTCRAASCASKFPGDRQDQVTKACSSNDTTDTRRTYKLRE